MNTNYNLTYPKETDYYDINVFNQNFSALADAIDRRGEGQRGEVTVAAFDSKSPLKNSASFTCTQGDCSEVIKKAVAAAGSGGSVLLLDGNFYVKNTIEITGGITLRGLGMFNTVINAENIFSVMHIREMQARIADIGFHCGNGSGMNTIAVEISTGDSIIEGCYFTMDYSDEDDTVAAIYAGTNGYISVRNCVFRQKEGRYMLNSPRYNMRGVIYGNYAEDINSDKAIAMKINLKDRTSYESVSFGAQKSEIYISNMLVN